MKIHFVLTSLLLSIAFLLSGQVEMMKKYRYQIGKAYEAVSGEYNFFVSEGDELLSVKVLGRQVFVQKYDGYDLLETRRNSYKDLPKSSVINGVFRQNSKYYFCYSLFVNGKSQLFTREIGFLLGELKEPQLLLEKEL